VVIGGIDTHKDIDVAALLACAGMVLGTAEFPTTRAGYRQLLGWMGSAGHLGGVGVEGTGSCGAGICRQLSAARCGGGGGEPAGPQPAAPPRQVRRFGCGGCRRSRVRRATPRHPEVS